MSDNDATTIDINGYCNLRCAFCYQDLDGSELSPERVLAIAEAFLSGIAPVLPVIADAFGTILDVLMPLMPVFAQLAASIGGQLAMLRDAFAMVSWTFDSPSTRRASGNWPAFWIC